MYVLLEHGMAILVALCVVVATIGFGAVTLGVAIPFHALALTLILCWSAKLFLAKTVSWKRSPMHVPVVFFFLYSIIRYSTCPLEYDGRIELVDLTLFTLIYFCITSNLYQPRDRQIFIWALMILALFEVTYGLWQFATKSEQVLWVTRSQDYLARAGGTFLCPNHLAGFLEMVLGLLIARATLLDRHAHSVERNVLQKIFIIYVILMIIVGIVVSFSRAGWLSTFLSLTVLLFWRDWRLRSNWPRLVMVLLALGMMTAIVLNWEPTRRYISKTLAGEPERKSVALKDSSIGGRTKLWAATAEIIRDHPAFGTGPGTWEWIHLKYQRPGHNSHSDHAHNDILQLMSDYGIVGFLIAATAILCFFLHARIMGGRGQPSEQRAFAVGSVISVVAILFHSWFDFNLHIPGNALLFIAIMAFTVALDDPKGHYPRVNLSRAPRIALGIALLLLTGVSAWVIVRSTQALRYTQEGEHYKEFLEWDEALYLFDQAVKWDPNYPNPWFKIGDVYRSRSLWLRDPARAEERKELARDAVSYYDDALGLNPYLSEVWLRRGRALEQAGEPDTALKSYLRSVEMDPQNAFNWRILGQAYRSRGDTNDAIAAFGKSFELMNWDANRGSQMNFLELSMPEKFLEP